MGCIIGTQFADYTPPLSWCLTWRVPLIQGLPVLLSALIPRFARLARRSVFAICVAMAPVPVLATPPQLPGSDDPGFREALGVWLANDEETALLDFSRLARSGNVAAQILLGLIDRSPALQGAYLAHLDRRDRVSLLRNDGGISGRNWLTQITGVPLVDAWMSVRDVSMGLETVRDFEALGEPRAARAALITMASREHPSLRDMDLDTIETDLLYLLWQSATVERRAQITNRTPANHPQWVLMGQRVDHRAVDLWLASSDAAAPLTALCQSVCPESGDTCRGAAYRALNSHNALLTLGTPAEALVSQSEFLASPRGQSTIMRRILLSTDIRGRRAMFARMQETSACLATALIAENQHYVPRLPGTAAPE